MSFENIVIAYLLTAVVIMLFSAYLYRGYKREKDPDEIDWFIWLGEVL